MPSQSPHADNAADKDAAAKAARIGDGPQAPRRPLIPRWIRLLLYPVFSTLLLLPVMRRLRRDARRWNRARWAAAAVSLVVCALGAWWAAWGIIALAGLVLTAALLLRPSTDPDRERDLQRHHEAEYLLNGGRLASAWPAALVGRLDAGTALYLLLRGREILVVPVAGAGEVSGTIDFALIQEILVSGESYRPVYISEAKDPPVREQAVDRKATAVMTLVMAAGERLSFEYEGAFSKHLAETAAHAIYSMRKLGTAHGVSGESPEIFHIVGR